MDLIAVATLIVGGLLALLVGPSLLHSKAALILTGWLGVSAAVPYWLTPLMDPFVPVTSAFGCIALVALVRSRSLTRATLGDFLLLLSVTSMSVAGIVVASDWRDSAVVVLQWAVPYAIGRYGLIYLGTSRLANLLVIFAGTIGFLAICEFLFNWHPFVGLGDDSVAKETWSWIQYRAGYPRSEWTFGHSIALGNVLAMVVPFFSSSTIFRPLKVLAFMGVLGGVVSSLSRNAIIAFAVSCLLTVLVSRRTRVSLGRLLVVGGTFTGIGFGLAIVDSLIGTASAETSASTDYRLLMVSLLKDIRGFGASGTFVRLWDGNMGYVSMDYPGGAARSIDNTLVLLGLRFGWIPTIALGILMLGYVARSCLRTKGPASVSVTAQIPTVLTVAMITQFASIYWFILGMAVTEYSFQRQSHGSCESEASRGLSRGVDPQGDSVIEAAR